MEARKYEIELWDLSGHRVADISHLCRNRYFTMWRNNAETLQFSMDLDAFETYCKKLGANPITLLQANQTEIKVRRNGQYLFGTTLTGRSGHLGSDGNTVTIRATGYLSLFSTRYVTTIFTGTDQADIAWQLINNTQSQTNGFMGFTRAAHPYLTGTTSNETYTRSNVKDNLQNLSRRTTGGFDFDFSWDKQFQTYKQIGSPRTDLSFRTGPAGNIKSIDIEQEGSRQFNHVIGLGYGFGPDQLMTLQDEVSSQLGYYRRETIAQFNSVEAQDVLDKNTAAYLAQVQRLLEIPKVTITGKELERDFIYVGDRVPLKIPDHPLFANVDGLYRVERMEVSIDENDFEDSIVLYFDDEGVDKDEF